VLSDAGNSDETLVEYVVGSIERVLERSGMREVKTALRVLGVMLESSEGCRRGFVGLDLGFIGKLLDTREGSERYEIVWTLYEGLAAVVWNCSVGERRLALLGIYGIGVLMRSCAVGTLFDSFG
jgi:hypothetical protein